jgi:malonyl CoA-acyl carrier protein transacylase
MTRIYLFPGQGSQKVGMGEGLFGRFPEQVAIADAELGYSVATLCLGDPSNLLNQTLYAQPALFVVNALAFLNHLFETGKLPGYVAGHSLGEYNALFAAGVFDFKTGVKLVKQRAILMDRASSAGFHSRSMEEAANDFGAYLKSFGFAEARIPVLSNVTARLHEMSTIKAMLARQITQPVRWTETIRWLLQQPNPEFLELGPGNVLTGLLRRIKTGTGAASGR